MFHNHYPDKRAYDEVIKCARAAKNAEDMQVVEKRMENIREIYGRTVMYCRAQDMISNIVKQDYDKEENYELNY